MNIMLMYAEHARKKLRRIVSLSFAYRTAANLNVTKTRDNKYNDAKRFEW